MMLRRKLNIWNCILEKSGNKKATAKAIGATDVGDSHGLIHTLQGKAELQTLFP